MSLYRKCGLLSGAALLCLAGMAFGAQTDTLIVESHPVKYVRADLATPAGAKKLYWRIQLAARLVCHMSDVRELSQISAYRTCYDNAVENAVAEVNATQLTALHRSRTQRLAAG